ncbi:lysylphosphatidylglycerol synthase transmembrane domain-containing protein [Fibrobacter succinogenes]|uniref:lysylphosphatidylglycerol synthase transmembrane domain-containing protein n=1 Tax=Fibrobacter succinogenes TaxID=833 RepID=UPI0015688575|nr:lysylphosphatidylglycerol synthase transmembrane domain-containing protein [Fibrobacter succinogenes]
MATDKTGTKLFVKRIIQLLVSIGGFAYIFYKIPINEVIDNWNIGMTPWILAMLVAATLVMAIQANRWKGLSVQGPEIPFKTYYAYTAMGYFFNNLLPTGFGGDAVKSIAFGKKFNQTSQSVSAVLLARIQGLLAMFLCFFIALPFALSKAEIPLVYTLIMTAASLACVIFILLCLFSDKLPIPQFISNKFSFIGKLQNSLSIYRKHKKQILLSSLDSLWLQLLTLFIAYAYFRAVGVDIDISILVVFTSITIVISMVPISLNGIGVREGTQVALFTGILGIPAPVVLSAGLLGYIPLLFQAAQGAVVLLARKK